jgi:hypothetical protein
VKQALLANLQISRGIPIVSQSVKMWHKRGKSGAKVRIVALIDTHYLTWFSFLFEPQKTAITGP